MKKQAHFVTVCAFDGGHIPMLTIRAGDFVPAGCGLRQHDDLCAFLVLSEYFVLRAGTGAQAQRIAVR